MSRKWVVCRISAKNPEELLREYPLPKGLKGILVRDVLIPSRFEIHIKHPKGLNSQKRVMFNKWCDDAGVLDGWRDATFNTINLK